MQKRGKLQPAFGIGNIIRPIRPSNYTVSKVFKKLKEESKNGVAFNSKVADIIIKEGIEIAKAYASSRMLSNFRGQQKQVF